MDRLWRRHALENESAVPLYAQKVGELQAERRTAAVPFLDLARVNGPLKDAVLRDVAALIDSNAFTNGPQVEQFEQAWADYCGTRYCVGLASGLDALRLALIALELEAGDEVIVPANTFIASVEAITQAGGTPVLVDATDADWNIDVEAAEAAVSPRTRAIMPVHLYGQMADMVALRDLAERHGLAIVEDACQAHGATRDGLRAGAAGTAGAFSFYPAKNLGAFGDAGALVTDDEQLAVKMRALREHGQRAKYEHEREGFTARLDTIQAVVLASKLPLLDAWTADRRRVATQYLAELGGINDLALPLRADGQRPGVASIRHLRAGRGSAGRDAARCGCRDGKALSRGDSPDARLRKARTSPGRLSRGRAAGPSLPFASNLRGDDVSRDERRRRRDRLGARPCLTHRSTTPRTG